MHFFSVKKYVPVLMTVVIIVAPLTTLAQGAFGNLQTPSSVPGNTESTSGSVNPNSYSSPNTNYTMPGGGGTQNATIQNTPSVQGTPIQGQTSEVGGSNPGAYVGGDNPGVPSGSVTQPNQPMQVNVSVPVTRPGGTNVSQTLNNPLKVSNFCDLIKIVLQAILIIGVPIAVIFLVIVGFKFILAQGNSGKIATARRDFLNTVIGIAIFLGAWAIAKLIAATLSGLGATGVNECVR